MAAVANKINFPGEKKRQHVELAFFCWKIGIFVALEEAVWMGIMPRQACMAFPKVEAWVTNRNPSCCCCCCCCEWRELLASLLPPVAFQSSLSLLFHVVPPPPPPLLYLFPSLSISLSCHITNILLSPSPPSLRSSNVELKSLTEMNLVPSQHHGVKKGASSSHEPGLTDKYVRSFGSLDRLLALRRKTFFKQNAQTFFRNRTKTHQHMSFACFCMLLCLLGPVLGALECQEMHFHWTQSLLGLLLLNIGLTLPIISTGAHFRGLTS